MHSLRRRLGENAAPTLKFLTEVTFVPAGGLPIRGSNRAMTRTPSCRGVKGCVLASSISAYHTENRSAILRNQSDEICGLCLQIQHILRRSFPDGSDRNAAIKSNKSSFMLDRESEKVYVGQLPRTMNSGRVRNIRIQQTDFIRPEFVDILMAGLG